MASVVRFRRYRFLLLFSVVAVVVFLHFSSFKDTSSAFTVDKLRQHAEWAAERWKDRPVVDRPRPQFSSPSYSPSPKFRDQLSSTLVHKASSTPSPVSNAKAVSSVVKQHDHSSDHAKTTPIEDDHWVKTPEHFPVPPEEIIPLPKTDPGKIPRIQASFGVESESKRKERRKRLDAVKEAFKHSWNGYKTYAWGHDEVMPVSKYYKDPFGGWGATLVDSLDTLWIMGMEQEFIEAINAVAKIDFTTTPMSTIPIFETVIRYLGGLIGAYDVSGGKHKVLLTKAIELGDMLYGAFDTPNRMPVLYWGFRPYVALPRVSLATIWIRVID
jgi:mannosyl-oligosaccharide alpha-1,2-mannosidase